MFPMFFSFLPSFLCFVFCFFRRLKIKICLYCISCTPAWCFVILIIHDAPLHLALQQAQQLHHVHKAFISYIYIKNLCQSMHAGTYHPPVLSQNALRINVGAWVPSTFWEIKVNLQSRMTNFIETWMWIEKWFLWEFI